MRIAVFEHICGGGMLGEPLPLDLVSQGSAMLEATATALARAGHDVVTLLDGRVCVPMPGVVTRALTPQAAINESFDALCDGADLVLVIAPETDGQLVRWLSRLQERGQATLCATPEAAALCADKLLLARHLSNCDVRTPQTWDGQEPLPVAMGAPVIVKPRRSVGCEHTFVCKPLEVAGLVATHPGSIVQPRIVGESASATLIAYHDGTIRPLRAGSQRIVGKRKLRYAGGTIPLDSAREARALDLAQHAVAAVPGLAGFIGVDLVLGESADQDYVIEINARCTLSLVVLAHLTQGRAVTAVLDADATIEWPEGAVSFDETGVIRETT